MLWNWQQHDWPHFTWEAARLKQAEQQFTLAGGIFLGTVKHLKPESQAVLTVEAMTDEAVTTSKIEGEILDRESVQSSIRRDLNLDSDNRRVKVKPAERGIGEVMISLFRTFDAPLEHATLFDWHGMMMQGRGDLRDIGRYRTHADPMQVVSGRLDEPTVHFEAPPSESVPSEMARFIDWFNRTAPSGDEPLSTLARAGTAHLYFESIHPFEDGNGRIGRTLIEKCLAQSLGQPTLTALAATILIRQKAYYRALEAANRSCEITGWLTWFAGICLEAQQRTAAQVEFLIDKARLLDRLRGRINERQEAALLRMLAEGPSGFKGGLSAANYISITKASSATATRDLVELTELGALTRTGERRHTRYHLSIPLREVSTFTINTDGEVIENLSKTH